MGAPRFAYRPVIPAIYKVFNKKVPFILLCIQYEGTPLGRYPLYNSVNGLSAQTFCSCTKDSYFIVPHEKLRFLSLKFTLKL